jgi:LysM repeat protein
MRLSEFLTEAPPVPAQPVAAPAIPTAAQQARLKDMEAGQAKGKTAIDKFNQGDNVGGVMTAASGINDLANAAGMSFLDKLETGWIAIKAGARAAWAGRKGNADAAIVAAVGSLGGEVSELFDDIVNEPDFAQKFQQGMLAMKDSTEPDQQEMYKKYMSRQLTAESFKAYINRFNTAIQNMKKNPETAKLPTDDTPYVTPEELPTGPNANPMSRDPSQRATTTETAELNRILQLSGMEFIAEGSTKSITVQRGDTLSRIAQDNSTTVDALVKLNNISNPDRIYPGDVIKLPGGQGDPGGLAKRQGAGQSDQSEKRTKTTTSTGNAKIAMEFFLEQGWTPEQAAGLVANLQAESYDRLDPAALGDKGRGYGIAQWHGPRQKKFEEIIGVPLKGSSLENQLKFVQWELTNPESAERSAGTRLKSAKTAADAAAVIDEFYERSSGIHRQRRIAKAEALLTAVA